LTSLSTEASARIAELVSVTGKIEINPVCFT